MKKHDYTALDTAILATLKEAPCTSANMLHRTCPVFFECEKLQEAAGYTAWRQPIKPAFRFLDARLQALRKAGKITFAGGAWSLVEAAA